MNGLCNSTFFWPRPLGPWGGVKRSIIINFQLQSQFQRFLYQTLCVFSQIKDIKHIKLNFHSVFWVMPPGQGWDMGMLGGQKLNFSEHGHVAYQIEWDGEKNRIQVKFSP